MVARLKHKNKKMHSHDLFKKGFETHPKFSGDYDPKGSGPDGPRYMEPRRQRKNKGGRVDGRDRERGV